MAGRIRQMLDRIIEVKSDGNQTLALATKTKLILKGLNPDQYDMTSFDDPGVVEKVKLAAREMGVIR